MFSKEEVEAIIGELRQQCGAQPNPEHSHEPLAPLYTSEWEDVIRDAYVGIAHADAGTPLGNLDPRVIAVLEKHQKASSQKA
jgi:hypothetical protein